MRLTPACPGNVFWVAAILVFFAQPLFAGFPNYESGSDSESKVSRKSMPLAGRTSEAVKIAGAPIPLDGVDQIGIGGEVAPFRQWLQREITERYLNEIKDKPWAGEIKPAVEDFAGALEYSWTKHQYRSLVKNNIDLIAKLAKGNPDDIWLQFMSTTLPLFRDKPDWKNEKAKAVMEDALNALPKTKEFAARRLVASGITRKFHSDAIPHNSPVSVRLWHSYYEALQICVDNGFFSEADYGALFFFLRNGFLNSDEHKVKGLTADDLEKFIEKNRGKFPAWIGNAALGTIEVDIAWLHRGSGWGSSVTDDGWKGFEKYLDRARLHLTASWKENPKHPAAARHMIIVTMAGGGNKGDTTRLWFDRCIAAKFDYMPAYSNYLNALRPRWGGSHEEMLAFAGACIDTDRYDTEVPEQASIIMCAAAEETADSVAFFRQDGRAAILAEAHKKMLTSPKNKSRRAELSRNLIYFTWLANDYATARKVLESFDWQLPDEKRKNSLQGLLRLEDAFLFPEIAVMTEAGADAYKDGQAFLAKKRHLPASEKFAEAEEKTTSLPGKRLCRALALGAKIEEHLAQGGSVDLAAPEYIDAWIPLKGKSPTLKDGVFTITPDMHYGRILVPVKQPEGDFEITARFEQTPESHKIANVGIAVHFLFHKRVYQGTWGAINAELWVKDCAMFPYNQWKQGIGVRCSEKSPYEFKIISKDGHVGFWANGKQIGTVVNVKKGTPGWGSSLLGIVSNAEEKNTVKLLEYTVRPLPDGAKFPEGTKFEASKKK